jgi:RNA polymerase sigma-70 factor (ECF subfamily)
MTQITSPIKTTPLLSDAPSVRNDSIDISLLARIREGDSRAFEQLYYRYRKPIYTFIFKTIRSKADSEDITQEAFVRLWNMREKIQPERNISALLFVLARRAAVDLYRRTGRMNMTFTVTEEGVDFSHGPSPEEMLEQYETKLLLDIAIENMPRKQREVFSLYFNEHLSPAEIAQRLNMSYENARKQIWNGKKQLREVISLMAVFLFGQF